jgi:deferrochelatase/peroxidase EfeB
MPPALGHPQAGILNRPPSHLLLAALTFVDRSTQGARDALAALADVVQHELRSQLDDPLVETGELGFSNGYDRGHLTITLGLSFDGFEALGTEKPADLVVIPWEKLGDTPPARTDGTALGSGDLVLQICSDDPYLCEHVVRRVEHDLASHLAALWTQTGSQRYSSRAGRTARHEGRALIGFLDGTSNLSPRQSPDDRKLVFVDPGDMRYPQLPQPGGDQYHQPEFPPELDLRPPPTAEPAWTHNGTYMTVRVSTFDTPPWDQRPRDQQEHAVGRHKVFGASLDLADDPGELNQEPAFAADQSNVTVPLDAHVRKANPRRSPEDAQRRIFRRGYPVLDGSPDGGMRRGLAFICFGRSLSTQFDFVIKAWMRNADFPNPQSGRDRLLLDLGERVHCGGYYFVPAIEHSRKPWAWILPAT